MRASRNASRGALGPRSQAVCDDGLRLAVAPHRPAYELESRGFVALLGGEHLQHLALVIYGSPEVVHLAVVLYLDLVQAPPPLLVLAHARDPHPPALGGDIGPKRLRFTRVIASARGATRGSMMTGCSRSLFAGAGFSPIIVARPSHKLDRSKVGATGRVWGSGQVGSAGA